MSGMKKKGDSNMPGIEKKNVGRLFSIQQGSFVAPAGCGNMLEGLFRRAL